MHLVINVGGSLKDDNITFGFTSLCVVCYVIIAYTLGLPRTAWTWTGLSVEESVRMSENRDKWRKYVHGVANPRIEDG